MNTIENEKLKKLKYMRKLATGLLIFMAVVYVLLKRYAEDSFLLSCIVSFAEASMIGALADWFAVVALFRHPLGFKWIPHTAIIQQNQDHIGDSLASFVVDNFFTKDVLSGKLAQIYITDNILKYLKENKTDISTQIAKYIPDLMQYLLKSGKLTDAIKNGTVTLLKNTEVSPYLESLLTYSITSKMHVPMVKQLISELYNFVDKNKDETMNLLEGINKALTLPIIGDLTYRSIVKTLSRLQNEIEDEIQTSLVKELLYNLPEKLVGKFRNSQDLHVKIEGKKNEFMESEAFSSFIYEKLDTIGRELQAYTLDSKDELSIKISGYIEKLVEEFEGNTLIKNKIEAWIDDTVIQVMVDYSEELGRLISDTVKEWPMEDMVEKLEIQVGGDLQYIRINGTVIGGFAGLAIHLLSYFF